MKKALLIIDVQYAAITEYIDALPERIENYRCIIPIFLFLALSTPAVHYSNYGLARIRP